MTDLAQTAPVHNHKKNQATLCSAYGVFGLPKETSGWQKAPASVDGVVDFTSPAAIKLRFKPDILGSSPKHAEVSDPNSTKLLHAAMRACLPNDVEVRYGEIQPPCTNHGFVLQQDSTSTVYGVCLQVWSKADDKRCKTIYEMRVRDEEGQPSIEDVYWIPYSLCFLSPYPLFSLLSDYLKGMWIHWSKSTNLFHAEEVSRILSFPAPRLQDLVRIDMKDYALAYQFPNHSSKFQNFAMWPLFSCLSVANIVSILETALSPSGRIIFITRHPAMLNIATESVRLACRVFEWTGLYVPVAHCSAISSLVDEKGPYMIGITNECRKLLRPPPDALVVDLDQGVVQTKSPPIVFSKSTSRQKFVSKLMQAIGNVDSVGVPEYLKEAYLDGQLIPEGQVICTKGRIDVIEDPLWWKQDAVLAACDHVCNKLSKNKGVKALTSGSTKKPLTTKISTRALQEIEREKSSNAREIKEAWLAYCLLKTKMSTEISKLTKRNEFLLDELNTWKSQFEKFQIVAQDLTKQSLELKKKIESYKNENRQLNSLIKERALEYASLKNDRDSIAAANDDLVKEKQHLKEKLRVSKKQNEVLLQQREEVEGVLRSLRQLIQTQPAALVEIIESKVEDVTEQEHAVVPGEARSVSATVHEFENSSRLSDIAEVDAQIETTSQFAKTLAMSRRTSSASKRISISDAADAVIREKTKEITNLINRVTADCVAAIDRINQNDEDDSPFDAGRRHSIYSGADVDASSSITSHNKRQSDMTTASDAIQELNLPVVKALSIKSENRKATAFGKYPFSQTSIQQVQL